MGFEHVFGLGVSPPSIVTTFPKSHQGVAFLYCSTEDEGTCSVVYSMYEPKKALLYVNGGFLAKHVTSVNPVQFSKAFSLITLIPSPIEMLTNP